MQIIPDIRDYSKNFLFSAGLIFLIFIAAWKIQSSLFLNWDVGWLLQATQKLWEGGNFFEDAFSPNPPAIMFFYSPAVILSKLSTLTIVTSFQLYAFLIAGISFFLSYAIGKPLFKHDHQTLKNIFFIVLAFVYVIYPMQQMGQREHIFFMLSMPYLLLAANRLENNNISTALSIAAGLLAGMGFSIKPQFLLTPLFIELFLIYKKKNLIYWIRIEILGILSVLITVLSASLILFPEYFFQIIPFVLKNYYKNIAAPWAVILKNMVMQYSLIPLIVYAIQFKDGSKSSLESILAIALISYLSIFFAQRNDFSYHIIPAFSCALLLSSIQLTLFLGKQKVTRFDYISMAVCSALSLAVTYQFCRWMILPVYAGSYLYAYLSLCCFISLIFGIKKISKLYLFTIPVFILLAGNMTSDIILGTDWYLYRMSISIFVMFFMFTLFAVQLSALKYILNFAVLAASLLFPVVYIYISYESGILYKNVILNKFEFFLKNQNQPEAISAISLAGNFVFPMINYSKAQYASRFDCLWPINELSYQYSTGKTEIVRNIKNNKNFLFFTSLFSGDLAKHKPEWLIVDNSKWNGKFNGHTYHINYIEMMSNDKAFKEQMRHYQFYQSITNENFFSYNYKLDIYKRIDS